MKIFCYGDSDTYGHDPTSPIGAPYPPSVRWTDRLAAATGWEIVNGGLNGREIPHTAGELETAGRRFAGEAPMDLGVVFLGSNDLFQGCSALETRDRMAAFLDQLTGYPLLLLAPVPMVSGTWITEERLVTESALLADLYEELARTRGVWFADPGTWDIEMAFDGAHYSPEGHRVFALRMEELLSEILLGSKDS